jgi:hypothetical protein
MPRRPTKKTQTADTAAPVSPDDPRHNPPAILDAAPGHASPAPGHAAEPTEATGHASGPAASPSPGPEITLFKKEGGP